MSGANDAYLGTVNGVVHTTLLNGKPFPEGQALQTWLTNVGALTGGQLPITVVVGSGDLATPWVDTPGVSPASTQYFSWDRPEPGDAHRLREPAAVGGPAASDVSVRSERRSARAAERTACAEIFSCRESPRSVA